METQVLAWGSDSRMPQMLFRLDMPKDAFLADDPLELPGALPYIALRGRVALHELGYLEGDEHTPENAMISQLRNWQGEMQCTHAEDCMLQQVHYANRIYIPHWPYCKVCLLHAWIGTNSMLMSPEASTHIRCNTC